MSQNHLPSRPLHEGTGFPSPFVKVLALGFYDGPTNGLVQSGPDGRVFKFDILDEVRHSEGDDLRIFSLAPLPPTSMARLTEALSEFLPVQWPLWVPVWQFPTVADREAINRITDQALQEAGPIEWVIAAFDLLDTIVSARTVGPKDMSEIENWISFLDLDPNFVNKHEKA